MLDALENINRSLFLMFNGPADSPAWLVRSALVFGKCTLYLIPLLLVAFWLWGDHSRRGTALKAVCVVALALAVAGLLGIVWPHPRPFVIGLGHQWLDHAPTSSFPSDHMIIFTAIGLTLYLDGLKGWGAVILPLAAAVAWARMFLGVHYPFDMIGAVVIVLVADAVVAPVWLRCGDALIAAGERIYRNVFAFAISAGWTRR